MLALLLVAAEETENVRPLAAKSLLVMLAIVLVVGFAVVLAGLGYFTSDKSE